MKIIETNWQWKTALSKRIRTTHIVLHHAAARTCTAAQIDAWHKNNGWSGIGYHYFVRKDGSIYRGRPEWAIGSHCLNNNSYTIGICAEGDYTTDTMPAAQKAAILELIKDIKSRYSTITKIVGHKDLGGSACPGANYPLEYFKKYDYNKANGGELTLTQYEELKKLITAQDAEIAELKKQNEKLSSAVGGTFIYNYMDENMPQWAREDVQWCVDNHIIEGTGEGLNLNGIKLWTLIVVRRAVKLVCKLMNTAI